MLNKYLKFLKGRRSAAEESPPEARQDAVAAVATTAPDESGQISMLQRFLGRQPVLDASGLIVGYELKLRERNLLLDGAEVDAQLLDEMLVISAIDLDFQRALGNKLTFIGVAPAMLGNPVIEQLPRHKVVVAIPLPGAFDQTLLERCQALVDQGIPIALDEFELRPEFEPFLKVCSYVRLDTARCDILALGQRVSEIRGKGQVSLVARNVETDDAFEACRKLGFDLYQGYYFTRLQPNAPHRLDSDRLRVMELLNQVMNHAELAELEATIKLDPGLTYKLLNFINAPANGLQQTIRSIGHALTLLGYDHLYRWLTLLLFASGKSSNRNRTLLKNALVRAHFTESLGRERFAPAEQGGLFIIGIFSLLDALLNVPMAQAIARLNLPQAVVDALLRRQGPYAPYLQLAIACENFDQDVIAHCAAECGLSADQVNLTHVNALIWGEGIEV